MPKYFAHSLLALPQADRPFQIKMVERTPVKSTIKRYTYMSNSLDDDGTAHISEETGYYIVGRQESVIFYSKGSSELNCLFLYQQLTKNFRRL